MRSSSPGWRGEGVGLAMRGAAGDVLGHPELSARLFRPRRRLVPWPFFVEGEDCRLACRHVRVSEERPTVVYFHGADETVADASDTVEPWLLSLGVNVLLAEYRGYGMSSGAPSLPAMLEDAGRVVRASGVPPSRLILFGRALGGLAAVHAASLVPDAAGLVLEATSAEPLRLLQALAEEVGLTLPADALEEAVAWHLDQRAKLAGFHGNVLVVQGLLDAKVPAFQAQLLHRWANPPRELLLLEHGAHDTLLATNSVAYAEAMRRLLDAVHTP